MPEKQIVDSENKVVETHSPQYTTRLIEIENRPRGWSYLDVEILRDGEKVGAYRRNYPNLYDTFVPFRQNGVDYALYSPNYTASRLMRLPECVDIGGEEPHSGGFCPTGYYVPNDAAKGLIGQWGFICGYLWGDDSSWKVQYLDLSEAARGILRREERFGYLEISRSLPLRDAIDLRGYSPDKEHSRIQFTNIRAFLTHYNRFYEGLHDEIEQ
jgi:hypothetical protein